MSLSEIALVIGGAAVGVASGSLIVYYNTKKSLNGSPKKPRAPDRSENNGVENWSDTNESSTRSSITTEIINADGKSQTAQQKLGSRIIPRDRLQKSKRELRTLLLEKELVSAALTRLYEAEAAREITREERETLGAKYRDELKSLDERILKIDAFIEVGDLETLRDQLVRLVNQKMEAIERRIEHTRMVAEPLIAEILNQNPAHGTLLAPANPRVPDISDLITEEPDGNPVVQARPDTISSHSSELSPIEVSNAGLNPEQKLVLRKRPPADPGTSDPQVEQLQKELLEALDRLEKLDVES